MTWRQVMDEKRFSVGIGFQPEGGLNTDPGDDGYTWVSAEMPQITENPVQYDAERSKQQRSAQNAPLPGRVWYGITCKWAIPGQPVSYDPTDGEAGFHALNALLTTLGQFKAATYNAACITSTDANTLSMTNTHRVGTLVAAREANGDVLAMGYVEGYSGGSPPYTVQLFEDLGTLSGPSVARIPTCTASPFAGPPTDPTGGFIASFAIRVVGEDPSQDMRYLGIIPTTITIAPENDRWMATMEGIAYGGEHLGDDGGLKPIVDLYDLDPILGRGGARWVFGSHGFTTTFDDGTADPEGSCDLRNVSLMLNFGEHIITYCPTGNEGVGAVAANGGDITCTLALPVIDEYRVQDSPVSGTTNDHILTHLWKNKLPVSLSCYQGKAAGKLFAWVLRQGLVQAKPAPVFIEGKRYMQATLVAGPWFGDTSSNPSDDASNRVFAVSQG